jgi:integrase/recombinase XerD
LYATLTRRAEAAGIEGFHPHMLRHTAAIRWLRAGGSVTGLMAQGGWTDIAMVQRYIQTASEELAIEESHRLDGGI